MNRFTYFESAVVGFLVGIASSTYLVFTISSKGFLGSWLSFISLKPVLDLFVDVHHGNLWVSFSFFVVVFVVYGILIGRVFAVSSPFLRVGFVTALLTLIGVTGYDQFIGARGHTFSPIDDMYSIVMPQPKNNLPQNYFGDTDIHVDINTDGKKDVVFIIPRLEKGRDPIYYLTGALANAKGYQGLNLIFLGGKVEPLQLGFEEGVVFVEYKDRGAQDKSETKKLYVKLIDEYLYQVKFVSTATGTTTEIVSGN